MAVSSVAEGAEEEASWEAEVSLVAEAGGGFGNQADFDTLIELITATIEPDTWEEVGGPGAIDGFPGGVYVDAEGVLSRIKTPRLAARVIKDEVATEAALDGLRKVSLPRLERALQLQIARGTPLPPEMRTSVDSRESNM